MIVLTRYTAVGCEAGSCMGKAAISLKNRDPPTPLANWTQRVFSAPSTLFILGSNLVHPWPWEGTNPRLSPLLPCCGRGGGITLSPGMPGADRYADPLSTLQTCLIRSLTPLAASPSPQLLLPP
eukprot:scaffold78860_cov30-Tisochrysis_lutea.AAC.2